MPLINKRRFLLVVGLTAGFLSAGAYGQDAPRRGETVTDRHRPEYSPLGARMGSFLLLPKLQIDERYDDNILAADTGTRDDFITVISPELDLRSTWSSHFLGFDAGAEVARFADNTDENYYNYNFGGAGRLDITRDSYIDGSVRYRASHEERSSADDAGGVEPTEYSVFSPKLGMFNRWNRVSVALNGASDVYDYDDVTTAGGAVIDGDDRDRTRYAGSVRLGYQLVTEYEAFVRASYNVVDYDDAADSAGLNRDSDGYEVVGGVRLDLGGLLFGDLFAGYRSQDYDDPTLSTIDGVSYGAALTWNPTGLTTLKASVERTIEETTQVGAAGNFATEFRASIDHELLRNLILGANVSFTINDYKGIARDDDDLGAGVYARYLIHRNLYLSASYRYEERESNVSGADYDKNVFLVRLETQF